MSYKYNVQSGIVEYKNNKTRYIVAGLVSIGLVLAIVAPASASKPTSPGCFGRDRAENITTWIMDMPEPEASWWGHVAADRAGTNGAQNQAYKTYCGGNPVTF